MSSHFLSLMSAKVSHWDNHGWLQCAERQAAKNCKSNLNYW